MLLQSRSLKIFADYHLFYLLTGENTPDKYTKEDCERRIKAEDLVVVIMPERNMTVPVEIEIHDCDPGYIADAWDHIAEASLNIPHGSLYVTMVWDHIAELEVSPDWYRVRSHHGGFKTIARVGTDGDDYYRVVLWPAPEAEVEVLKQAPPR
jgi:hypothetical protein